MFAAQHPTLRPVLIQQRKAGLHLFDACSRVAVMNDAGPELSARVRDANIGRMQQEAFDVAVIGGGITGAGVLLDAASRGFSAALIEKRDFASGTSSRSSKLIHGGLRYLEHFQFSLVREALRERATLARIAPHLAEPLEFLIPLYDASRRSPLGSNRLKLKIGLTLYDLLAGGENLARHRWVTPERVLELAPALEPEGLRGGFIYYDGLTNDSRLVIEVIKAAAARGAVPANYVAAQKPILMNGRVSGVEACDTLTGNGFTIRAKTVVNATGVWAGEVARATGEGAEIKVRPSKGIHIIVPAKKIGNKTAVLIPSVGEQRFLFVIPWLGRTMIGTTDTDYRGDLDEPVAEPAEINRVLESTARYFPGAGITSDDVISAFAGLRPLVGREGQSTTELSRKEEILEDETGMISVIGGKLTTYRRMAERIVDMVSQKLASDARSLTAEIPLAGVERLKHNWPQKASEAASEFGLPLETVEHLMRSYGGNYQKVLEITRESAPLKNPLLEELPHIEAEVVYCARFEMITTVEDFLARRTRISLLARDHGSDCASRVAELMGRKQGRADSPEDAQHRAESQIEVIS